MTEHEQTRAEALLLDFVLQERIGWIWDEGKLVPPFYPHGEHKYDGACAVCRCGDNPLALSAFLIALESRESLQPIQEPRERDVSGLSQAELWGPTAEQVEAAARAIELEVHNEAAAGEVEPIVIARAVAEAALRAAFSLKPGEGQ